MDEEVHEGTYVAVVQTVLKLFCYRCLRFIQLVCIWHIWTCKDASQLCLLEHVTHPTPVDVSLPMYSFLTLFNLAIAQCHICCLLQLCLAPQAAESSFLVPGLILSIPHSV